MAYTIKKLNPFGILIESKVDNYCINNIDFDLLLDCFNQYKLIILRGFKTFDNTSTFADYCEQFGEISLWPFGKVLELIKQENPDDHIFDNSYMPLHWDGMYRPEIPKYQIFHCVDTPSINQGGETTFVDSSLVLELTPIDIIKQWETTTVRYTRKMQYYESTVISKIVTKHPYKNNLVIRYNEPLIENYKKFINPPKIEFIGTTDDNAKLIQQNLQNSLNSPHVLYAHNWQKNDVVIADNFNLLHGRNAFSANYSRHLQRVHVNSSPVYKNPGLEVYKC